MSMIIERPHNFTDRLNHIEKKNKYFYLKHEHDVYPIKIEINSKLNKAFLDQDWKAFEDAEAIYYGGELENIDI